MVKPFLFTRPPSIIFGNRRSDELPALVKKTGKNALLITGRSSFINSSPGKKLLTSLKDSGIKIIHFIISEEPSTDVIDTYSAQARSDNPDIIIAIGGGSVMDAGKAISAMIPVTGSVIDYLEGVGTLAHPGTKVPLITVPTTSGTGSEATKNAVISRVGKGGFKKSLRHDNFVPEIALVDPLLTLSCPPDITAASGMDCFTQLTESYLSDKSNEYTDALALEGLKAIKSSLIRSYVNGDDVEARSGMSFAALTSGICLANAGLGIVHGFASSIGGMYDIPHGVVCGTLMAKANEVTVRELRKSQDSRVALNKYAVLGKLFLEEKGKSDDYYTDGFIAFLHNLTTELNLPVLKQNGMKKEDIEVICRNTENKNNPVKLCLEDLIEIITERFD